MGIAQVISAIPEAGHRGVDLRDDFVTKQEAFQDALTDTTVDEINTWRNEANQTAQDVNDDQVTVTAKEALMNPHYVAIEAVYANEVNVNKVAVIDTAVSDVAAIDSDVTIAATNVADITNFADVYQGGKATAPTTRNDSSPLQEGDMYYDTTTDYMRLYDGAVWSDGYSGDFYTTTEQDGMFALKAPLASPTFTGTVALPSTTSIGTVSSTEIGYVDGVTSSIQTQINTKAPLASPTFTGTVTLPGTTDIGTVSSTEIGYVNGVTSAIQTQINAKADQTTTYTKTEADNAFVEPDSYATSTVGGTIKARWTGTDLYITIDGSTA